MTFLREGISALSLTSFSSSINNHYNLNTLVFLPTDVYTITMSRTFDPELLYVECTKCGQPVLWKHGLTAKLLKMAKIDPSTLDERCVITSDGCPGCTPGETTFTTQVIRLNREKDDAEPMSAAAN